MWILYKVSCRRSRLFDVQFKTDFTFFGGVSIDDFELENAGWIGGQSEPHFHHLLGST